MRAPGYTRLRAAAHVSAPPTPAVCLVGMCGVVGGAVRRWRGHDVILGAQRLCHRTRPSSSPCDRSADADHATRRVPCCTDEYGRTRCDMGVVMGCGAGVLR